MPQADSRAFVFRRFKVRRDLTVDYIWVPKVKLDRTTTRRLARMFLQIFATCSTDSGIKSIGSGNYRSQVHVVIGICSNEATLTQYSLHVMHIVGKAG